jgi:hypothetical protein
MKFDKFGYVEEHLIIDLLRRGEPFTVIFTPTTPNEKEQHNGK